ncbi:DUF2336 domain-containing protein [Amphiplicatus metriothermophilus]|uniref:Uncharacterized conserved protein, DUF2336 family n=1 Tax=Amphiplicatus metriothermophilus TaxID=1519374 RepID=A0A239PZR9_9PROT|nr:DUF2336 domain-containing protein [Amphiplicatus metriothermophilus]MBB5518245.1 uncharacterized protein (DUF2336 family) [Amphiplicatus metriothermophilus]SNT75456.1 Uncharacterized conserved protein, DUF2336 family [Amphiplicatus metriothermophilus]
MAGTEISPLHGAGMDEFEPSVAPEEAAAAASGPERSAKADIDHEAASARALLARKLGDIVVLPAARVSGNERALAADILMQIVDKVEEALRVEIARRLARVPETPPALIRMLLLDEPAVAREILQGAENLPQALLIEAARCGQTAHREMIARRHDLTTAVADVLVEFHEPEITRLLLRREEFMLSPGAIDILVARSVADQELQTLLLRRRELEPAHGFLMFWWVDAERRRRILSRFTLDRSMVQDAVRDLYPRVFRSENPDPFVKEILIMLERRHRPRGVDGETVSMDIVKNTLAAARRYPAQEMVHAVSMVAGVSRELAGRILRDPGGEPYAVMCKALGVSRDSFFGFLQGDDPAIEGAITPARAEELMAVFDSMARDFARAILRYWDWEGNPRIARITRLLGLELTDEAAFV